MLVVYVVHFALSVLLTSWGASLTLRALAARRAARREALSVAGAALPASVWHRHPTSPSQLAVTALLGLIIVLVGAGCFGVTYLFDEDQNPYVPQVLSELLGGVLFSGSLAAAMLGVFADRSHGRVRCPRCWYDMQGQPTLQCPECGTIARNQRDLQRTRRSPGMLLLAGFLLLLATLANAAVGYTVGGPRGAVPTWTLIVFADALPRKWITPGGGHSLYGSLQDRWKHMDAINRWFLLQRVRIFIADDYSALASIAPAPVTTNLDALFRSEHAIAYAAMQTDAGANDMLTRVRAILSQPVDKITDRDLEELGMLAGILENTRFSELRGPRTPVLPTLVMQRVTQNFSRRRSTLSYLASSCILLRHEDPAATMTLLLRTFDASTARQSDTTFLVIMMQRMVQLHPEFRDTLAQYLLSASADRQVELLSFRSMIASTGIITQDTLAQMEQSSDDRVRLAATLFAATSRGNAESSCDFIVAVYNAASGPDRYIIRELTDNRCPLQEALPGLERDLPIADADTVCELARAMYSTQFCDPQLVPVLEQVVRSRDNDAIACIYDLLLQSNPQFDPGILTPQPK